MRLKVATLVLNAATQLSQICVVSWEVILLFHASTLEFTRQIRAAAARKALCLLLLPVAESAAGVGKEATLRSKHETNRGAAVVASSPTAAPSLRTIS